MNRLLVCLVLTTAVAALADEAETPAVDRDRSGLLRAKLPPIAGESFLKKNRLEIFPSVALSFRDAFFRKTVAGASVGWHFSDALALSVHGGYAFSVASGAMQICSATTTGGCQTPDEAALAGRAPGDLLFVTGGALEWTPLYGKISLLAETFRNFELYTSIGGTLVGYRGVSASPGGALALSAGGEVGLGARFFFTHWLSLRLELKDLVYVEQTQVGAQTGAHVRQQFFGQLGLSLFLPSTSSEG